MKKIRSNLKNNTKNQGISLIALIITIIVIIILASAIILTINNNNPLEKANEARFKSDIISYQEDLTSHLIEEGTIKKINIGIGEIFNNGYRIQTEIPSIRNEDAKKFGINNNELVYSAQYFKENERIWLDDLGIRALMDGDSIQIENGNDKNIQHITVSGKTTQTPELFDYSHITILSRLNELGQIIQASNTGDCVTDYIPVLSGQEYTIKFSRKDGGYHAFYDENKNFITTFDLPIGTSNITIPSNASYLRITYYGQESSISIKIKNLNSDIMINSPTKMKNLSNFEIKTNTKNYISYEMLYQNLKTASTGIGSHYQYVDIPNGFKITCKEAYSGLTYSDTNSFHIEPGKMYRFSFHYQGEVCDYFETPNIAEPFFRGSIESKEIVDDPVHKIRSYYIVFKEGINDVSIRWFITTSGDTLGKTRQYSNFSLVEVANKEEQVPYVAYDSSSIRISETLLSLPNNTADMLYFDANHNSAWIERKIGKVTLTGNENWTVEENSNGYTIFSTKAYDSAIADNKLSNTQNCYATHFLSKTYDALKSNENGICVYDNGKGNLKIKLKNEVASTASAFQTWLQQQVSKGSGVEVYYPLKKITKENISYTGSLKLFDGFTYLYKTGMPSHISIVLK